MDGRGTQCRSPSRRIKGDGFISHKADSSFFESKRPWSPRKDRILGSYLAAYLPKIATQKCPIVLVDAFAGPGIFLDGEKGSPLIMCEAVRTAMNSKQGLAVAVHVIAIENDDERFEALKCAVEKFPFAEAIHKSFLEHLPRIVESAATSNVFLYVDPFAVEGLDWSAMDKLFALVNSERSVEVLLNFNAGSFVRRGLSALELAAPATDSRIEDLEAMDIEPSHPPSIARLHAVVGGDWWERVLRDTPDFSDQVSEVALELCRRLAKRFKEVCIHPVKALPHHTVPKYYLIFGSRYTGALRLMNDEMVKSRETLADLAKPEQPTLFETRSEELVPSSDVLPGLILKLAQTSRPRGDVIIDAIRQQFGNFLSATIRGVIETLIKSGKLASGTGKARINDDTPIWRIL